MQNIQIAGKRLQPSKIVCVGRNYVAHIKELDNAVSEQPIIFIKPNSAISDEVCVEEVEDEIHYEGEISFVVKNHKISAVGFGLDLTKRVVQAKLQEQGLPWERAKAFDGSAVFSEFIIFNRKTDDLRLELHINGELVQQGSCTLMLFKPADIINDVSSFLTLADGDVIMTGTPAGVGQIKAGDELLGKIFEVDKLLVEKTWLAS